MKSSLILSVVLTASVGFAESSWARSRGGGNEVTCMANALAGEALATNYSMTSVAEAIMARKARGGYGKTICQIVYAPRQVVGVHKGARKGGPIKAMANRIAKMVIATNRVGDCTDWKTRGYHRGGYLRGGNVFHNCRGGRSVAGGHRSRSRGQTASLIDSVMRNQQTASLESAVGAGSGAAF